MTQNIDNWTETDNQQDSDPIESDDIEDRAVEVAIGVTNASDGQEVTSDAVLRQACRGLRQADRLAIQRRAIDLILNSK